MLCDVLLMGITLSLHPDDTVRSWNTHAVFVRARQADSASIASRRAPYMPNMKQLL